jgi:hypothetical protein
MLGREGLEPSLRLRELARAGAGSAGDLRVVPGDCDVYEALEEVALGRVGSAPRVLERLVRLEVAPRPDQREALLVPPRGLGDRALRRRP